MGKIILGVVIGMAITLALNFFGLIDLKRSSLSSGANDGPVFPQELISGAEKFGSLNVVITAGGAFVSGIEVDVGERPGGKMAVGVTDKNGTAVFEKMPVGKFVIFFNDNTFPKNFERVSNLIPIEIIEGRTTEQKIELKQAI